MASDAQKKFLSTLDSILLAIKLASELDLDKLQGTLHFSINPFDFLLQIIGKFITEDGLRSFLVGMLTITLPVIEIGVKGVLLTNLKKMSSCNIDPWIPDKLRRERKLFGYDTSKNGLIINPQSVDYKKMLQYSPNSDKGQGYYQGITINYYVEGDVNSNGKYKRKYTTYEDAYKRAKKVYNGQDNINLHEKIVRKSSIQSIKFKTGKIICICKYNY